MNEQVVSKQSITAVSKKNGTKHKPGSKAVSASAPPEKNFSFFDGQEFASQTKNYEILVLAQSPRQLFTTDEVTVKQT